VADVILIDDLVRYDPIKGCFVLKPEQQIEYWPGTNTPKSTDNDFNWRNRPSMRAKPPAPSVPQKRVRNRTFTIYSKARASR
jgi:hypothetical protein